MRSLWRELEAERIVSGRHIEPARAPIWELSLSARTQQPTVFSPYNIKDAHACVKQDYPTVERQPEFSGYEIHPTPGVPSTSPVSLAMPISMLRWWFGSSDGHRILQLQDNFIAANWRKEPAKSEAVYPGYHAQKAEFFRFVNRLKEVDPQRPEGAEFPEPDYCEISYDNFIPLRDGEGRSLRYRDVLNFLGGSVSNQPVLAWSVGWFQSLPDADPDGTPEMRIQITGGVNRPGVGFGSGVPSLRIQIVGRSPVTSWQECSNFFDRAHAASADTLFGLTTEATHSTWRE